MYSDEEVYDRVSMPHDSHLAEKSTLRPFERAGRRPIHALNMPMQPSLAATRRGQAAYPTPTLPADLADDDEVLQALADVQAAECAIGGPPQLPGAGVGAVSGVAHQDRKQDNLAAMQAAAAQKALHKKLQAIENQKKGISTKKPRPFLKDEVGEMLHGFPSDVPEDRMTEYQRASRLDRATLDAMTVDCDRRHLRKKNSLSEHREKYAMIKKTLQSK